MVFNEKKSSNKSAVSAKQTFYSSCNETPNLLDELEHGFLGLLICTSESDKTEVTALE